MKKSKTGSFKCSHCKKSFSKNDAQKLKSHLINECFPNNQLGVTIEGMLEIVALKYPVLQGSMLSPLPDSECRNGIDCIQAFRGTIPHDDSFKKDLELFTRPISQ